MIEVRHSKTNETIPVASTLKLGRGTKLGGHTISDSKCSVNQVRLELVEGRVRLTCLGMRPSLLLKGGTNQLSRILFNETVEISPGDRFFLWDDKSEMFEVLGNGGNPSTQSGENTENRVENFKGSSPFEKYRFGGHRPDSVKPEFQSPEKRSHVIVDEDDPSSPVIRNVKKQRRAIVDSDDEDSLSIPLSSSKKTSVTGNKGLSSGWISVDRHHDGNRNKRGHTKQSKQQQRRKSLKKKQVVSSDEEQSAQSTSEDENEAESSGNESSDGNDSYEEEEDEVVTSVLSRCETIAAKMRSILSSSGADNTGEDHLSATRFDTSKSSTPLVSQNDIFGLDEGLKLKSYQMVGINWLYMLHQQGVNGVLADEMGLGKTVQTITFLALLNTIQQKTGEKKGPHLIVVPASVLSNWKREFQKFCPVLRVEVYHGSQKDRYEIQDRLTTDEDFDILLTTYSYFERENCKDDRSWIKAFRFGYMVLDEGHSIKNSKSSRFARLMAVKSRNRLLLSGTPVQNALSELLSLLTFIMPTIFDCNSETFQEWFSNAASEQEKLLQIKRILGPFILRRLKEEVLDQLPSKKVEVNIVEMEEEQKKLYNVILEKELEKRRLATTKKQEKPSEEVGDANGNPKKGRRRSAIERELAWLQGNVQPKVKPKPQTVSLNEVKHLFTELRKAANHPLLLRRRYVENATLDKMAEALRALGAFGDSCTFEMVRKEIETYSDFELHNLCVEYGVVKELRDLQLPKEVLLRSGKMNMLQKILPQIQREGRRVLLFSQWTKLLDLLEIFMDHHKFKFIRLDGSTAVGERQQLIDTFNKEKDIFIFLLSTRAGGLGLNLTAADTVILHDLDFNPHNDRQAEDRCHRIGQLKDVTVIKLVSQGTVDEEILKLGQRKKELDTALLGDGNNDDSDDTATMEDIIARALSAIERPR